MAYRTVLAYALVATFCRNADAQQNGVGLFDSSLDDDVAVVRVPHLPLSRGLNEAARMRGQRYFASLAPTAPRPIKIAREPGVVGATFADNGTLVLVRRTEGGWQHIRWDLNANTMDRTEILVGLRPIKVLLAFDGTRVFAQCSQEGGRTDRWFLATEDLRTGKQTRFPGVVEDNSPNVFGISDDSSSVVCRSMSNHYVWHPDAPAEMHRRPKVPGIAAMALDSNGRSFITGPPALPFGRYGCQDLAKSTTLFKGNAPLLGDVCLSRKGKLIAAIGEDLDIGERTCVWDQSGDMLIDEFGPGKTGVCVRFSNSEDILATVTSESVISLRKLNVQHATFRFVAGSDVSSVCFSRDDKVLTVVSTETVKVFEMAALIH